MTFSGFQVRPADLSRRAVIHTQNPAISSARNPYRLRWNTPPRRRSGKRVEHKKETFFFALLCTRYFRKLAARNRVFLAHFQFCSVLVHVRYQSDARTLFRNLIFFSLYAVSISFGQCTFLSNECILAKNIFKVCRD